jgi:predicted DNA-binding protein
MAEAPQTQTQISVRVPSEHVEALEDLARKEDRTVTAEVRRLIRQHLADHGRLAAAA